MTKPLPKILMFGSGTNVGRVAKAAKKVDAFVSVPYRLKEKNDPGTVERCFVRLNLSGVEDIDTYNSDTNGFSWAKVFKNPRKSSNTLQSVVQGLFATGDTNNGGLQLDNISIDDKSFDFNCVMLWCSADNKQLDLFAKQVEEWVPNSLVQVFNGDFTNNREAEELAKCVVAQAKQANKRVIFISNTMASRSFSVSEIEASILMFDRGQLGATEQKGARCLTNGCLMNGEQKRYGFVISLSTDANRTDSLTEMQIVEAQRVAKAEDADFTSALKDVLNTLNIFSDRYNTGTLWQAKVDEVMLELRDSDKLIRAANAISSFGKLSFDDLCGLLINVEGVSSQTKLGTLIERVKAQVTLEEGNKKDKADIDEIRKLQAEIARKIATLNESALTVADYTLNDSSSYREALESFDKLAETQFEADYGITSSEVVELLDAGCLAEELLDLVVYNQTHGVQW
jgi:hypothetical protein